MAATIISSAAGVLALLDEPEEELQVGRRPAIIAPRALPPLTPSSSPPPPRRQVHALKSLDAIVDTFWTEISEYVSKM